MEISLIGIPEIPIYIVSVPEIEDGNKLADDSSMNSLFSSS